MSPDIMVFRHHSKTYLSLTLGGMNSYNGELMAMVLVIPTTM